MMMAIYKITNNLDNKIYIGQTIQQDPMRRIKFHFKDYISNHGYIHRAIKKYGHQNFSIEILENTTDPFLLNKLETYNISYYNCMSPNGYNHTAGGDASGIKSEETLQKMRTAGKKHPLFKKGMVAWNKGKSFSLESRIKMSLAKKGKPAVNLGKKYNKEYLILSDDGIIYYNPGEAAHYLNVKPNTVIKACTDKKQIRRVRGHILTYINKQVRHEKISQEDDI